MIQPSILKKDKFEAKIIENNMYYIRFFDKTCINLSDIISSFEAYDKLSKGKKIKVLIEFGIQSTIDDDARKYAEQNKIQALAEVLIIKSIAYRILAIIYFKYRVQTHPIKIQSSLAKGIEWLKSIN